MITVIIAEQNVLELFEAYKMFLNPLLDKETVTLCRWNKDGKTIDEMLPDIYEAVALHDEWKAIIIDESGMNQLNPFDFVDYKESDSVMKCADMQGILERRNKRLEIYTKAFENPLLKLTTSLSGVPSYNAIVTEEENYHQLISGEQSLYEYMLTLQLDNIDIPEVTKKLGSVFTYRLLKFVKQSDVVRLIDHIRNYRVKEILSMLETEDIIDFIRVLGDDDLLYTDPEYVNCIIENTYKEKLYHSISKEFTFFDKLPNEVICVAPRNHDCDWHNQEVKWKNNLDENAYSSFAKWNMYPIRNKYILYDIVDKDHKQYSFEQIKELCFISLLARYDIPNSVISNERVYCANIKFDKQALEKACACYLAKLKATYSHVNDIDDYIQFQIDMPTDGIEEEQLFASEIQIPTEIAETYKMELYAKFDRIGLATDCPENEKEYWNHQYRNIEKRFTKYLREPKRVLKSSVSTSFREECAVEDERIYKMSPNQLEDVAYKLVEEEENMIATNTSPIFNDSRYKEELEKSNKELNDGIKQRMTRNKTLLVGILAIAMYFIGFIPLILSNSNTKKSLLLSMNITWIVLAVFFLVGLVFLFVLKHRLLKLFKHFNAVMYGICNGIEADLKAFSDYLSHACNVMKAFNILQAEDSDLVKKQKILRFHKLNIEQKVQEFSELFVKYLDAPRVPVVEMKPYDYDFELFREYKYEMPYVTTMKKIEFLQLGNEITVEIDYIDKITLIREEFYD